MSNIPSNAVAAAFLPVQRATHEPLRARQVQTQKNFHHAEEVDELDDTAVNSVADENQNRGNEREKKKQKGPKPAAKVDIADLEDQPTAPDDAGDAAPHLDISA